MFHGFNARTMKTPGKHIYFWWSKQILVYTPKQGWIGLHFSDSRCLFDMCWYRSMLDLPKVAARAKHMIANSPSSVKGHGPKKIKPPKLLDTPKIWSHDWPTTLIGLHTNGTPRWKATHLVSKPFQDRSFVHHFQKVPRMMELEGLRGWDLVLACRREITSIACKFMLFFS